MADYISVAVSTTTEAADIVSLILIEEGSKGVSVLDSADIEFAKNHVFWDYVSEKLPAYDSHSTQIVLVSGVFELDADLTKIRQRLEDFRAVSEFPTGSLAVTTQVIKGEDFENEWKKYYQIMEIGGVAIVPDWLQYDGDKPAVYLNPGKAFGTGSHETTAMCIRLMQDADLTGKTVFDVGCGSGILGLCALRLGAENAVLTDIDPQAVESARQNAQANGLLQNAQIICSDLTEHSGADVLLANLTADLLIRLQPLIKKAVVRGGKVIVSGIIHARADDVLSAFSDFRLEKSVTDGEWQAFMFTV